MPFKDNVENCKQATGEFQCIQTCVKALLQEILNFDGIVRQFIKDDKGYVLIAGFMSHLNDSVRAVRSALACTKVCSELGVSCCVGVTSGKVFTGLVGS